MLQPPECLPGLRDFASPALHVGRIMAPLPMSQSLETVSVLGYMAKGTKITDGIKLAH